MAAIGILVAPLMLGAGGCDATSGANGGSGAGGSAGASGAGGGGGGGGAETGGGGGAGSGGGSAASGTSGAGGGAGGIGGEGGNRSSAGGTGGGGGVSAAAGSGGTGGSNVGGSGAGGGAGVLGGGGIGSGGGAGGGAGTGAGGATGAAGTGGGCATHADCAADQYCSAGRCAARVCQPGAGICQLMNTIAVCDAAGSGYLPPQPCGPIRDCIDNACQDPLFREDFESGLAAWKVGDPGAYGISVATPGANGTNSCLSMYRGSQMAGGQFDGLSHTFFGTPIRPRRMSWWARTALGAGGPNLAFSSGEAGTGDLLVFEIGVGDRFEIYAWTNPASSPGGISRREHYPVLAGGLLDRWYHVEIRNMDWTRGVADFFVDGARIAMNVGLGPAAGVKRIDIYGGGFGGNSLNVVTYDEIELH